MHFVRCVYGCTLPRIFAHYAKEEEAPVFVCVCLLVSPPSHSPIERTEPFSPLSPLSFITATSVRGRDF